MDFMSVENPVQSKYIAYEIWDSYAVQVHSTGFFNGHEIHSTTILFTVTLLESLRMSQGKMPF